MTITCSICLDTIKEQTVCTPCGHVFHRTCLKRWIAWHSRCPCCKRICYVEQMINLYITNESDDNDELNSKNQQLEVLKRQLVDNSKEFEKRMRNIIENSEDLRDKIEDLEVQLTQSEKEKIEFGQQLIDSRFAINILQANREIDIKVEKAQVRKLEGEIEKLKKTISVQPDQQQQTTTTKREIVKLKQDYQAEMKKLQAKNQKLVNYKIQIVKEIENLKKKLVNLEKELAEMKNKLIKDSARQKNKLKEYDEDAILLDRAKQEEMIHHCTQLLAIANKFKPKKSSVA